MKRNLMNRIATAVAFVGIAAVATACGSSNNNGLNGGIGGIVGGTVSGSGGCIPLTPVISFQGQAQLDSSGGVIAGTSSSGPLNIQSVQAAPATNPPNGGCSLPGYTAGRCGSDANLGLTVTPSGYSGMGYGGTATVSGTLQFNQLTWSLLQTQLGGGYSQGYGAGTGCVSAMEILGNNPSLGMDITGSPNLGLSGGDPAILSNGAVILIINGQQAVLPF